MGNLPQGISTDELYDYTHGWTAMRLRSFPLWDFDDIRHEAFVVGVALLAKYDSSQGTVHQFLSQRLYDYVSRAYYRKNDIVVTRRRLKDGSWGRREYTFLLTYISSYSILPNWMLWHHDNKPHDYPDLSVLPDSIRNIAYLLSKGNSKKDCATIHEISPSAVSQKIRRLRDVFSDEHN